jgi:hypothetical protein
MWIAGCGGVLVLAGALNARAGELTLEARPTRAAPKLDGRIDDAAWKQATPILVPVLQVPTEKRPGTTIVVLRAVRTAEHIFLAASWNDPTNSFRKEEWTFDGKNWSQDPDTDEDRLALIFPIADSVPWFATSGCTLSCHHLPSTSPTVEPRWYMATRGPTERFDAWHWKSTRTNPLGYTDDKYWNNDLPAKDRKNAGRHYDPRLPGPGGASRNAAKDGKGPAFMQDPNKKPSYPGALMRSEAVPFDASRFKAGDTVPGRVLSKPAGNLADIDAAGVWHDNTWHVEMRRALNTGHDEDVVFKPGDRIPFSVAVFDNISERRKQDHGKCIDLLWLVFPE